MGLEVGEQGFQAIGVEGLEVGDLLGPEGNAEQRACGPYGLREALREALGTTVRVAVGDPSST